MWLCIDNLPLFCSFPQGGVSSEVTMTAYVLIALQEVKQQRVALDLPQVGFGADGLLSH